MNIEHKSQRKEYGEQFVNFTQQSNRIAGSSDPPYITVMKGFYEFNTGKPERAARHFNLIANMSGFGYIYNVYRRREVRDLTTLPPTRTHAKILHC